MERESERHELMEKNDEGFGKIVVPDFSNIIFLCLNAKRFLFIQAIRLRMVKMAGACPMDGAYLKGGVT